MSRAMENFYSLLDAGRVVDAILVAPFGYSSRIVEGGRYRFKILDGPLNGQSGEAPTLDEAVRLATSHARSLPTGTK